MACPRCGCRIISKLGKGHAGQLICADCGLDLTTKLALQRNGTGLGSQFMTIVMISVFGITAIALMVIKDRRPESLDPGTAATVDLNKPRDSERGPLRWIVVPRLPGPMNP
jgi:hypothetical protein